MNVLLVSTVNLKRPNGGVVYTQSIVRSYEYELKARVTKIFIRGDYNNIQRYIFILMNFAVSIFTPLPSKVFAYVSLKPLVCIYTRLTMGKVDLILLDHDETFWLAKFIPNNIEIVGIRHNNEIDLYKDRISRITHKPILSQILEYDVRKFRKFISGVYGRFDKILTINMSEISKLKLIYKDVNFQYVPPRFYTPHKVAVEKTIDILFVGDLNWYPNSSGLNWFISNVLFYLKGKVTLSCVGNGSVSFANNHKRVIGLGYVDRLETLYWSSKIVIAPIFEGSGANVKVAEYLAYGCSLMTTEFCAEPYNLNGQDCFISNDASQWVSYINKVMNGFDPISPSEKTVNQFRINA